MVDIQEMAIEGIEKELGVHRNDLVKGVFGKDAVYWEELKFHNKAEVIQYWQNHFHKKTENRED